jgi:hypothetical protein
MQLNKIKLYYPYLNRNQSSGGGGGSYIIDNPYDPYGWDGDILFGPSRNSVRDLVESMGYNAGKVIYVDATNGNDSTGRKGNVLKPFQNLYTASAYSVSGDLIVIFPGTYTLFSLGLPLRDGVDYYILNADFINNGYSYGLLISFPFSVSCRIFGKGRFIDTTPDNGWALITPYMPCNLEIEGMSFTGNRQIIGQLGLVGSDERFLSFKNCRLISNDNMTPSYVGAGNFGDGSAYFEDCYIKGYWSVSNSNMHADHDYKLFFKRCRLEANPTNGNGFQTSLGLWDYYGDTQVSKVIFENCVLKSTQYNITAGDGYGGIGMNKLIIVKDSYFLNSSGWIENNHANLNFKLINNWSSYSPGGSSPVNNLLTGTGFSYDSNLE